MFGKKKCKKCGSKIEKSYEFCPYCGLELREKDGLLDEIDEKGLGNFDFNFNNSIFSRLINKLSKDLEKQFQNTGNVRFNNVKNEKMRNPNIISRGLSISISSNGSEPVIKVRGLGDDSDRINVSEVPQKREIKRSIKQIRLTKEQEQKLEKLPKIEPKTIVRRLSNKVIYEIDIPGARKEDILINKFKSSIEIKAFAKDKVFIKIIPVGLPILRHSLNNGKLNLELKPEM